MLFSHSCGWFHSSGPMASRLVHSSLFFLWFITSYHITSYHFTSRYHHVTSHHVTHVTHVTSPVEMKKSYSLDIQWLRLNYRLYNHLIKKVAQSWIAKRCKCGKYSPAKFAKFVYICVARKRFNNFPVKSVFFPARNTKIYTNFANFTALYFTHFTTFRD